MHHLLSHIIFFFSVLANRFTYGPVHLNISIHHCECCVGITACRKTGSELRFLPTADLC